MVLDRHLEAVAIGRRAGDDQKFVQGVRRVIDQWNYGFYDRQTFALDPVDCLVGREDDFRLATTRASRARGSYAWPMPKDLFRPYPGRAPDPRPAWDIAGRGLIAQPGIEDYVAHFHGQRN